MSISTEPWLGTVSQPVVTPQRPVPGAWEPRTRKRWRVFEFLRRLSRGRISGRSSYASATRAEPIASGVGGAPWPCIA
jgi:hypothetical protein